MEVDIIIKAMQSVYGPEPYMEDNGSNGSTPYHKNTREHSWEVTLSGHRKNLPAETE